MKTIPASALETPIDGIGLRADTFGEEIGDARTLLVFLRHFG